jgi:hypothetical protein
MIRATILACSFLLISALPAQQQARPIIYVKHLEPPCYPPLARMTRVSGTIEMKLKIGADGAVLSVESVPIGYGSAVLTLLKDEAEKDVKTWTFGCAGCPSDASFQHDITFHYILDDNAALNVSKVTMDLPDQVTMSAGPPIIDHGADTKILKKRSH